MLGRQQMSTITNISQTWSLHAIAHLILWWTNTKVIIREYHSLFLSFPGWTELGFQDILIKNKDLHLCVSRQCWICLYLIIDLKHCAVIYMGIYNISKCLQQQNMLKMILQVSRRLHNLLVLGRLRNCLRFQWFSRCYYEFCTIPRVQGS